METSGSSSPVHESGVTDINSKKNSLRPHKKDLSYALNVKDIEFHPDDDQDEEYVEKNTSMHQKGKRNLALKATERPSKQPKTAKSISVDVDTTHNSAAMNTEKSALSLVASSSSSTLPVIEGSIPDVLTVAVTSDPNIDHPMLAERSAREFTSCTIGRSRDATPTEKGPSNLGIRIERQNLEVAPQGPELPQHLQRKLAFKLAQILEPEATVTAHLDDLMESFELVLGFEKVHSLIDSVLQNQSAVEDRYLSAWLAILQQYSDFHKRARSLGKRQDWATQINALEKDARPAVRTSCARLLYVMSEVREKYGDARRLAQKVSPILLELCGGPDYMLDGFTGSVERFCNVMYSNGCASEIK